MLDIGGEVSLATMLAFLRDRAWRYVSVVAVSWVQRVTS